MKNITGSAIPVVLFDGDCAFCNGSVRWLLQHERRQRFYFAALQSDPAVKLLALHGFGAVDLSSIVVLDDGVLYRKSNAVLHLLGETNWPWRVLRIFGTIPRPLRDAAYDFIGRHRYRWWGSAEICIIGSENLKSRIFTSQ